MASNRSLYSGHRFLPVSSAPCSSVQLSPTAVVTAIAPSTGTAHRVRKAALIPEESALSAETPMATTAHSGDSARMFTSTAAEIPNCSHNDRALALLLPENRARLADQTLNAVAISRPLGLIVPERNRHMGVRATATPHSVIRREPRLSS